MADGAAPRPLRLWCVSDGRAGIERQTLALADAFDARLAAEGRGPAPERRVVRLHPGPPQVWLPPDLWPAPLAALPADERAALAPPWPDIWIAAGRRSIPYSLRVRAWSGGQTLVVQTQDPRVATEPFDLVVPPLHDRLAGPNVEATLGGPVWFSEERVAEARAAVAGHGDDPGPRLLVVLGGTSRRHRFGPERAAAIAGELERLARTGWRLWITASRRTPGEVAERFRALAAATGGRFWAGGPADGPNPYAAWLSWADAAAVTEDSANMLAEAAFFGLKAQLLKLDGGDRRFDHLHAALVERGAARWFDGDLSDRSCAPLREAWRVAGRMIELADARASTSATI